MLHPTDPISGTPRTPQSEVMSAIRQASERTGVDFSYLLEEAKAESSLNPAARAATTSARGLFQFIESTWLEIIDRHGAGHGLEAEAAAITRDSRGRPVVNDPEQRAAILNLRDDPRISALMAAELALDNEKVLQRKLGREVSNTELYMAHFLGAGGAAKFLQSLNDNPDIEAEYIVPAAARNNQAVFYKGGQALTLHQVFDRFAGRFGEQVPQDFPGLPRDAPATMVAEAANPIPARQIPAAGAPSLPASLPTFLLPSRPLPLTAPQAPATAELQHHAMTMLALEVLGGLNDRDKGGDNEWVV